MNIFFDNYSKTKKYTGVQNYSESLYLWLEEAGLELSRLGFGKNHYEHSKLDEKIKFVPQKLANRMQRYSALPRLDRFVEEPIDIAIFPDFVIWPIKANRKIVVVHDFTFLDRPGELSPANARYLQKQVPKSLKIADTVITTAETHKKRMVNDFSIDEKKIIILPSIPNKKLVKKQSPPKEKSYIFSINSIEPRKNIGTLLDAYVNLPKEIKDSTSLILTGVVRNTGKHILEIINRLQNQGENIIYKGRLSDEEMGKYLQHATALVSASHYEGFGMQLLEASLAGVPVICSDIPIFKDVMRDSAQYFNQNDSKDMALSIQRLLENEDLRKDLIKRAKKNLKRYDEKDNIKKLRKLL